MCTKYLLDLIPPPRTVIGSSLTSDRETELAAPPSRRTQTDEMIVVTDTEEEASQWLNLRTRY